MDFHSFYEQEHLLAEWAEKDNIQGNCMLSLLHNQSEKYCRIRNYAFTIPVIILNYYSFYTNWYYIILLWIHLPYFTRKK